MSRGGVLEGFRVVDLTQMLAGPYATMMLADLGADVIKVEPPESDLTRIQGPHLPDDNDHFFGGYFQSVNRGKRSIAIDLKSPRGCEVVRRLVGQADAVVENFRAGVMDRLGLSYESLSADNPRLVYAAIRGFGDPRTGESPYVGYPAFDVVAQAMGGLMGMTGPGPGQPMKVGPGVGDIFPSVLLNVGLLAAVMRARDTGVGQFLDVAMYDAVIALCERMVYLYSYRGQVSQPQGNTHPLLCPFGVFPTTDGHVTIAAPRDPQWRQLVSIMGMPELADDPRFRTNADRAKNSGECLALVQAWTSSSTKAGVMAALGGLVPAGPVNSAADIVADPHVAARAMLAQVEHPGSAIRPTIAGTPIKLTGTPSPPLRRAPLFSEHASELLSEVGFTADEVAELRRSGAVL
jgi:crotonobetainyl-CoA:carnitine CoA-transferase CaiB-like acyl-CoA transferase